MRILLGMSGGVDSSVAALVLKNMGYDVTGVTLLMADTDTADDINAARDICSRLGIPHCVADFRKRFHEEVERRFAEDYINGITPNPCAICNKLVKLRSLDEFAAENGFDKIATGHYARCVEQDGAYYIKKSADASKDQTYMLCMIDKQLLPRLIFPLGDLTKSQIREIALQNGFECANKPDSQDICFIKDGDYAAYIRKATGFVSERGSFVDKSGAVIGTHGGHINFTVGQRKGLGMGFAKRMYVLSKNTETNEVMLGDDGDLFSSRLYAKSINLLADLDTSSPFEANIKTRYSQRETKALIHIDNDTLFAEFVSPVRAITCGQPAAIYIGDTLIGGAEITGV